METKLFLRFGRNKKSQFILLFEAGKRIMPPVFTGSKAGDIIQNADWLSEG
jgi:hypothetical protein